MSIGVCMLNCRGSNWDKRCSSVLVKETFGGSTAKMVSLTDWSVGASSIVIFRKTSVDTLTVDFFGAALLVPVYTYLLSVMPGNVWLEVSGCIVGAEFLGGSYIEILALSFNVSVKKGGVSVYCEVNSAIFVVV
ncbi:18617_t:CDS:2 [Dentiscutata erythropus]|uniref:18617_t:CDS:1 n=1 Tax=Dentiscutata erythropus TaxID=1348616 RepID=A0A9N8W2W4_9GLOM|nr:18617_t:CDS:2 [Dentiscutata erythropus]